ncbi:class I SAM-dependent methyltransferase [Lacihabitans sp. LS3-19]|uniref:class I SAM-dependent methyltransferase n=1 Tax=Lacihabitans sp. LS3-19 TaxID=2487335 RepID=UPI0020CC0F05|nr:class I SAM-dependent methyltransferase [Lacihabitans sp. LS3-19]MCP9766457.1 class I SAM-dependent methyltransferase [Lacihabitans sp. LS3-19]
MAFDFHADRSKYFQLQYNNTKDNILPMIENQKPIVAGMKVLEIGCRDGGVLMPFLERGCTITGFDLDRGPVESAQKIYADKIQQGIASFFVKDVHDYIAENKDKVEAKFDIIVLKDVIEHVYGHEEMISNLKHILLPGGVIYFGFPPWQNPFGGHQQVLHSKLWSSLPYYHMLPNFIYYGIMKRWEKDNYGFIKATKETRITPEKFERLVKKHNFEILENHHFFIATMYKYKFGIKPRKQSSIIKVIPYFRNFFTTAVDYVIRQKS